MIASDRYAKSRRKTVRIPYSIKKIYIKIKIKFKNVKNKNLFPSKIT